MTARNPDRVGMISLGNLGTAVGNLVTANCRDVLGRGEPHSCQGESGNGAPRYPLVGKDSRSPRPSGLHNDKR